MGVKKRKSKNGSNYYFYKMVFSKNRNFLGEWVNLSSTSGIPSKVSLNT